MVTALSFSQDNASEYPGKSFYFETLGSVEFLTPINESDNKLGSLSLEYWGHSLWENGSLGLTISYIWQDTGPDFYNIPALQMKAGYAFSPGNLLRIHPYAGGGICAVYLSEDEGFKPIISAGLDLGFHLRQGNYLNFRSSLSYPFHKDVDPTIGFGVSLSSSMGVILPYRQPSYTLEIGPQLFSPDGDGESDTLFLNFKIKAASNIEKWSWQIYDSQNHLFAEFSGEGPPEDVLHWDGKSYNGELVSSASKYPMIITLTDVLGNNLIHEETLSTDILVVKDGDKRKIRIPSIHFPPNSGNLGLLTDEMQISSNHEIIRRLAEIISLFPSYQIRIEGHANNFISSSEEDRLWEEQNVLIPLSLERADAVRLALIEQGIQAERLSTAGMGGAYPLFSVDDEENRWKNRRVEFILLK
jgi:outer membrane protein OmpA-like peptidoglycan-associated protein